MQGRNSKEKKRTMSSLVRRKKAPGIKRGLLQAQRQGAGSSSSQEAQDGMVASLGNTVRSKPV